MCVIHIIPVHEVVNIYLYQITLLVVPAHWIHQSFVNQTPAHSEGGPLWFPPVIINTLDRWPLPCLCLVLLEGWVIIKFRVPTILLTYLKRSKTIWVPSTALVPLSKVRPDDFLSCVMTASSTEPQLYNDRFPAQHLSCIMTASSTEPKLYNDRFPAQNLSCIMTDSQHRTSAV